MTKSQRPVATNRKSAGVLLYRWRKGLLEVLLVHPGGPYWRNRDAGAWQLPKGLIQPNEALDVAARREAQEELGLTLLGPLKALGQVRQAGGKHLHAFALAQNIDPDAIASNEFTLEWPPGSGHMVDFPEVDRARWMSLAAARDAILPSQRALLDRLETLV